MQELNGNFSHFPKPSLFQGLEGARNNSLISHTDSVLGKKLEEECGIRRAVGAVSVFLHWPLLLLNAIPGCLYSENPLLICSTPTTQVPGLWILHPLTVLSSYLLAVSSCSDMVGFVPRQVFPTLPFFSVSILGFPHMFSPFWLCPFSLSMFITSSQFFISLPHFPPPSCFFGCIIISFSP